LTGAIMLLQAGVWLVTFLGNINFVEVGHIAYAAGIVTGLALIGVFNIGQRMLVLRPEPVYRKIIRDLSHSPKATTALGGQITAGRFRAYSVLDGGVRWKTEPGKTYDGWQRFWKPRRLQMLFTASGDRGVTGLVICEVQNDYRGKPFYNILALEMLDAKGAQAAQPRIVLDGDPKYSIEHGPIRLL